MSASYISADAGSTKTAANKARAAYGSATRHAATWNGPARHGSTHNEHIWDPNGYDAARWSTHDDKCWYVPTTAIHPSRRDKII